MIQTIWKFPIQNGGDQTISMPSGAEILCVQVQDGEPCLWAKVSPGTPPELRKIRVHGTGGSCQGGRYIGTYQLHGGSFVGHVFEA